VNEEAEEDASDRNKELRVGSRQTTNDVFDKYLTRAPSQTLTSVEQSKRATIIEDNKKMSFGVSYPTEERLEEEEESEKSVKMGRHNMVFRRLEQQENRNPNRTR